MKTIETEQLVETTGGTHYARACYPGYAPLPYPVPPRPAFAPPRAAYWPYGYGAYGGGWWAPQAARRGWWW